MKGQDSLAYGMSVNEAKFLLSPLLGLLFFLDLLIHDMQGVSEVVVYRLPRCTSEEACFVANTSDRSVQLGHVKERTGPIPKSGVCATTYSSSQGSTT